MFANSKLTLYFLAFTFFSLSKFSFAAPVMLFIHGDQATLGSVYGLENTLEQIDLLNQMGVKVKPISLVGLEEAHRATLQSELAPEDKIVGVSLFFHTDSTSMQLGADPTRGSNGAQVAELLSQILPPQNIAPELFIYLASCSTARVTPLRENFLSAFTRNFYKIINASRTTVSELHTLGYRYNVINHGMLNPNFSSPMLTERDRFLLSTPQVSRLLHSRLLQIIHLEDPIFSLIRSMTAISASVTLANLVQHQHPLIFKLGMMASLAIAFGTYARELGLPDSLQTHSKMGIATKITVNNTGLTLQTAPVRNLFRSLCSNLLTQ